MWVVSASSSALKIASVRMCWLLLRPASNRGSQPTGKLLDARSSGTARKTLLADALCLPGKFRKNTSGRSRKCPSRNLSRKLPQLPSFAPTRIERCSAPSFPSGAPVSRLSAQADARQTPPHRRHVRLRRDLSHSSGYRLVDRQCPTRQMQKICDIMFNRRTDK
jgi:hypothetical protein